MEIRAKNNICSVCLEQLKIVEILSCGHEFCKNCLRSFIKETKVYPLKCPSRDDKNMCSAVLTDDICYKILSKADHAMFNKRRQDHRFIEEENLYPCYEPSCPATIKLGNSTQQRCQRCGVLNCYKCYDTHLPDETCEMWAESHADIVNFRNKQRIENELKIETNKAIYCPKCKLFIEVIGGCDWICCVRCQLEICLKTKMSRWGPGGHGDTSGGCKCKLDGITKCHPDCSNCH